MKDQEKRDNGNFILAGDIGGTKANLAIFTVLSGNLSLLEERTYPTRSADSAAELLHTFLADTEHSHVDEVCLGFAGPVVDGVAKAANFPWTVSQSELGRELDDAKVWIINDLLALACGVPLLRREQILPLNSAAPDRHGNIGVIAAGTGLGEALLVWDGSRYVPCPSEGGHKDFAARNTLEFELLQFLADKYDHVSIERILSGPGLINLYDFFLNKDNGSTPEWLQEVRNSGNAGKISQTAMDGSDQTSRKALDLFIELYGAEAGNLALQAVTSGGIYIGGGIAPKIADALQKGHFLEAFAHKGRMSSLLEKFPVRLILDPKANLWGAASYCRMQRQQ